MDKIELEPRTHVIPWEDDIEWDDFDELDEWGSRKEPIAMLNGSELLPYTLGHIVSMTFILHGSLILDYPLAFLPESSSEMVGIGAVFAFAVICLATFTINLYVRCAGVMRIGFIDGLWPPYIALGLYLLPQILIHLPFLLLVIIAGIALTAWESGGIAHVNHCQETLWYFTANAALVAYLVVLMGGGGLLPMATSGSPSAHTEANYDIAALNELMGKTSLDDMSYQEVADTMQAVAHMEAGRLGMLNCEPRVMVGYTGTAVACYSTLTRTITLSASRLSSPGGYSGQDAIQSIAHEMAHAYEHAVIDGRVKGKSDSPLGELTPKDTARWQEELRAHVDANKDFDRYWRQDIEIRARRYAEEELRRIVGAAYAN